MKPVRRRYAMAGISLVEILVSLAIGMVVIAAVIVSYLGSGQASRYQTALSQMNQDAQVGLNIIARDLQLAGYSAPTALVNVNASNPLLTTQNWVASFSLGTATNIIFGCDGVTGSVPFTNPAVAGAPTCSTTAGTPTVSALEVVYEADLKNTVPHSTNVPTDCLGGALTNSAPASAIPVYIVRNRYFIDRSSGTNTSGRPELYCASNVSAKRPLLENVDDLQVWYGLQVAANPRQVVRYVKAGKDNTTLDTVNAVGGTEWANVVSVRICLLMRSETPILNADDSKDYLDCDSNTKTSTDNYLRRAYFTTATARSRMAF